MPRNYDRSAEPIDLKFVRVETETTAAWLVIFDTGKAGKRVQEWMPKSQCDIDDDDSTVTAPRWLVERKGLEVYAV